MIQPAVQHTYVGLHDPPRGWNQTLSSGMPSMKFYEWIRSYLPGIHARIKPRTQHRPVARSGFGGAFFKKMDFFACFFRESGLVCVIFGKSEYFRVLLGRKWTILLAFLGESGLICAFLGESGLFWPKLWTILDTFGPWGGAFAPLAPPLATGLYLLDHARVEDSI